MGVGEAEPFTGEAVQVRSLPGAGGVVGGDITDAEVVGEDVDNVGWRGGVEVGTKQQGDKETQNHLRDAQETRLLKAERKARSVGWSDG